MSVHDRFAPVSSNRSWCDPNASWIQRSKARAPASIIATGYTPFKTLCARSVVRKSPRYTSSAVIPSRSISASRTSTSCTPRTPPTVWASTTSGNCSIIMLVADHTDSK